MARRRVKRRQAKGRWLFLALGGALLFAVGWLLGSRYGVRELTSLVNESLIPATEEPAEVTVAVPKRDVVPGVPRVELPPLPGPADGASVALLIDDLGRSLTDLDRLEALQVPLSYAVLPFESRTGEVVEELRRRREEILCHLPMESLHGANPGLGALRMGMTALELGWATRKALDAVPGALGVNNHMGSGITFDRSAMGAVLEVVSERGLFFIDSRTSKDTVVYELALSLGIPAAERHVFLDADPEPVAIRYQFRRLLQLARQRGSAIAIGHPHPNTVSVLASEVPAALEQGYRFVPASYLLDRVAVLPE
jgi:polysaccharide deacetylase 2 family uncharacterized protein YibQ